MNKKIASLVLILSTISVGCGAASVARPDPRGGRIQLEGAYMPAMAEARMLMLEHCGGRFEMHEDAKRGTVSFACVRPGAPTAPVVLAAR